MVVLLLFRSRSLLSMRWFGAKGLMEKRGGAPEGNARADGFPILLWANRDLLARVVANLEDGLELTRNGGAASRLPDTESSLVWRVK